MTNKTKGDRGELLACRFLQSKRMHIIARNWRFGRGEIDIIAKDKDTIVFIEVKFRESLAFGRPEEALTQAKQASLRRTIAGYLSIHPVHQFRVDVIAILEEREKATLRHLPDVLLLQ